MAQEIGYVAVVVREYDEALAYFTNVLGFDLIEDNSRWIRRRRPKCGQWLHIHS
jgi:catechol 2,3-dioxygenase-like lactoylglutathione lyase family enzyme